MAAHLEVERMDYCEIFDETLALWEKYAVEYRSLLPNYYAALEKRRAANISGPLNKIKESELKKFPKIELLDIENEDDAIEYLLNLTESNLVLVRSNILDFFVVDGKLYKDLKVKTFDYLHKVRMKKARKSIYAINPDSCGCGRKCSSHKEREYRN